jgi:hypothetical protein
MRVEAAWMAVNCENERSTREKASGRRWYDQTEFVSAKLNLEPIQCRCSTVPNEYQVVPILAPQNRRCSAQKACTTFNRQNSVTSDFCVGFPQSAESGPSSRALSAPHPAQKEIS